MVETQAVEIRIVEMRTYKLKPGMRSAFLEIFRSTSIPAHAEIGFGTNARVPAYGLIPGY
jgi:hypothetical protein